MCSRAVLVSPIALFAVSRLALIGEYETILDRTAPFEDVWIVWRFVTFANNFGGTKLEFWGKRGFACPFYVVFIIRCA